MRRKFIKGTLMQFVVLFGLWLLLSGKFDFFHMTVGFFSALVVTLVHLKINKYLYFTKEISGEASLSFARLALYIPWLMWEIVVASLQVAYVVLHPKMPIQPRFLRFTTRLPNVAARVILGNSITLTPGTLTVAIEGDEFIVHTLTDQAHSSIEEDFLPRQVARLYHRRPQAVVDNVETVHFHLRH
jgi:multicomponent Na+:H+ antiporter subunit E